MESENDMKKCFRWSFICLAVWLAAQICPVFPMDTAYADGYDRIDTVAVEERMPTVRAAAVSPNAWKKINGVCYNGSGVKIPGAITRGIDVSEWNETINWSKVKNSAVDFAFVRISYGLSHMDAYYDYNMRQSEAAGVPVGTYVYSTATTTEGALAEAQLAIEKMRGYKVSYPVVYDLEYSAMGKLSPSKVSELARTFCDEVKRAGYYPMVYCNTDWYDNHIDWSTLSGIDVWIARYGDTIQAPSKSKYSYTVWQSTDGDGGGSLNPTKGLISGINPNYNVDVNFGYVDYTRIITPRYQPVAGYTTKKNGFITENGNTYYYKDGAKMTGWITSGGYKYYFDPVTAAMSKGLKCIGGKYYYFWYGNGVMRTGWMTDGNTKCYFDPATGERATGLKCIDGKYYYFWYGNGVMRTGWMTNGNTRCYFDPVTGERATGLWCIGGKYYYFWYGNGVMRTGWMINGNTRCYFDPETGERVAGWRVIDGKRYYFWYANGVMRTGWVETPEGTYYLDPKTGACVSGFATIGNQLYYFHSETNHMQKSGWMTGENGYRYYLDPETGALAKGLTTIDGKVYYFWYGNGVMRTGWMESGTERYYFDPETGQRSAGWKTIAGQRYYFWYGNGVMRTGWMQTADATYYLDPKTGAMAVGEVKIGSVNYTFDENGRLI